MISRGKVVLVLLSLASLASACLWDRDTLAEESRADKEPLSIIVGHFERNPPLYYQMRLDRVTKEIGASPTKLDLYDDAGVACDRLSRHDEAILWMERKARAMGAKGSKDDRYRYHSNLGSFYAHRWFVNKPDWVKTRDLDLGIEHIRKALGINPNAHFGREKFQLGILEWVRTQPKVEDPSDQWFSPLASFLLEKEIIVRDKQTDAVKGLLGLIRLGTAWENIDVFAALAEALATDRNGTTAVAALARVQELQNAGKISFSGFKFTKNFHPEASAVGREKTQAEDEYHRLRKLADKWHEERIAFMMPKLEAGQHPDTDKRFWDGFTPRTIEVRDMAFYQKQDFWIWTTMIGVPTLLIVVPLVSIWLVIRMVKRRNARLA